MDTYDLEQVNNILRKLSLERYSTDIYMHKSHFGVKLFNVFHYKTRMSVCRPFRPSLSSFSRISSSLKPVQELTLLGDNLLKDISLVGGNESGIFISSVQSGSAAEKVGLREGHHLLLVCSMLTARFKLTLAVWQQPCSKHVEPILFFSLAHPMTLICNHRTYLQKCQN